MTPWLQDADVTLYHGDVLDVLRELPAKSVDCCVTSPPYWGLRDYGQEGQLGLEPTPEEYVTRMVEVFREVRRVLAAHGTVWLNLGDSYGSGTTADRNPTSTEGPDVPASWSNRSQPQRNGLKPKDLVGIPWRVAFALQADGWYLRSDIIWAKPNPMPESVTDRPTKAHEYVFLLSKQPRYFFDQEAVRERYQADHTWDAFRGGHGEPSAYTEQKGPQDNSARGPDGRKNTNVRAANGSIQHRDGERWPNGGRNIRSVWEIATQPYPEAHFATFPEELARRCIAAGCPESVCRVCGRARERITERKEGHDQSWSQAENPTAKERHLVATGQRGGHGNLNRGDKAAYYANSAKRETLGFTDCGCLLSEPARETRGCERGDQNGPRGAGSESKYRSGITLDPFMGSGTVAHVARKLARHAVGIDLSEEYLKLAARRLQQQSLFAEPAA